MKNGQYWTLASWEGNGWYPQFGDYTKSVVFDEFIDTYRDDPTRDGKRYRIVSSAPELVSILARLADLPAPANK